MAVGGREISLPERRIFLAGALLGGVGIIFCGALFGVRAAISTALGAALSALNLIWLRSVVSSLVFADRSGSKRRVLTGFMLRLLLTPLILYAMLRALYLSLPAAAAGYALVHCGILVEGIREAFRVRSDDDARA